MHYLMNYDISKFSPQQRPTACLEAAVQQKLMNLPATGDTYEAACDSVDLLVLVILITHVNSCLLCDRHALSHHFFLHLLLRSSTQAVE